MNKTNVKVEINTQCGTSVGDQHIRCENKASEMIKYPFETPYGTRSMAIFYCKECYEKKEKQK